MLGTFLCLALVSLTVAHAGPSDTSAVSTAAMPAAGATRPAAVERYAVEFRARPGGVAGHSYVVFGKLDSGGKLRRPSYAGFRPNDGALGFIVGSVVAYSGTFQPSEEDINGPVSTVYRRLVTGAQYRKLTAYVAKARQNFQHWNLVGNNCNDFVAGVAEALGMRAPSTLLPPDGFVELLRVMNEP